MSVSSDLSVLSDLRRQGELTAEEYAAARSYVLKHGSLDVPDSQFLDDTSKSNWRTFVEAQVGYLGKLLWRWKKLIGLAALFMATHALSSWGLNWLVMNDLPFDNWNKLNVLGAAGWTAILLACGGLLVGYNIRILKVICVPLFLFLLLSPLWNGAPAKSDGPQVELVYSRPISATEYGKDWPFPNFPNGMLRCEHMTKDDVTRRLVSVELAYRVHGLNGPAIGWAGYSDARDLMAKHPEWGTFELGASDRMISEALAHCV